MSRFPGKVGLAAVLAAGGVLLWLSTPGAPRPLAGLSAFLGLVPLLIISRPVSGRPVYWRAFLLLLVYFLLADSWLWLHFSFILPFKAAGSAAVALIGVWLFRRLLAFMPITIAAGLGWASLEWFRVHLPELPCPHHQLSHSLFNHPWFIGTASLWGEVGLNFIVAGFSGALAGLWISWREGRPSFRGSLVRFAMVLSLVGGCGLLSHWCLSTVETRPGPEVGIVQGNRQVTSLGATGISKATFSKYLALTRELVQSGSLDLVAWPESTMPIPVIRGFNGTHPLLMNGGLGFEQKEANILERQYLQLVAKACQSGAGGGFILGGLLGYADVDNPYLLRWRGAGFLCNDQGRVVDQVEKHNLVPGGEYLPLFRCLPFGLGLAGERLARKFGIPAIVGGRGNKTVELPRTGRFGLGICYDNAFQDYFSAATTEGATWHLIISNEAWYGAGAELDQLLAMSVIYAVATRRSIVRSTNSGISCLISPVGQVTKLLDRDGQDRNIAGVMRLTVPIAAGQTFLVWCSGWLGFLVFLGCLMTLLVTGVWRKRPGK